MAAAVEVHVKAMLIGQQRQEAGSWLVNPWYSACARSAAAQGVKKC